MLSQILIAAQILLLVIIAVVLVQIFCYLQKFSKDDVITDERAAYLIVRTTILVVCFVIEAALQIVSVVLRFVQTF